MYFGSFAGAGGGESNCSRLMPWANDDAESTLTGGGVLLTGVMVVVPAALDEELRFSLLPGDLLRRESYKEKCNQYRVRK